MLFPNEKRRPRPQPEPRLETRPSPREVKRHRYWRSSNERLEMLHLSQYRLLQQRVEQIALPQTEAQAHAHAHAQEQTKRKNKFVQFTVALVKLSIQVAAVFFEGGKMVRSVGPGMKPLERYEFESDIRLLPKSGSRGTRWI